MPSLYETTAIVGEVSSSNFTTLYNSSGLSAPNTGGGAVSSNLNVGGNLTVQGTSLLIGAVALQSTLSLPNYTFPSTDGTTDQVLTTDGSGNLYFTSVAALGASYVIQANPVAGGADLALVSSTGITDSVKFEGTGGITISRVDSNTIAVNGADPLPVGTADGQMLVWEDGDWIATSLVDWTTSAPIFQVTNTTTPGRAQSAARLYKNTDTTPYTTGDGSSLLFGVDSASQSAANFGSVAFAYSPVLNNIDYRVSTSTDNFATRTATSITGGNTLVFSSAHGYTAGTPVRYLNTTASGLTGDAIYYVIAAGLTTTQCQLSTTLGGSAITLTNGSGLTLQFNSLTANIRPLVATGASVSVWGTNLVLNAGNVGGDATNATIAVERGQTGADATITWNETTDTWELNNNASVAGDLAVNGGDITTTATTGNLFNANAVVVNVGNGATTEVNLGNLASGRVQVKSPLLEAQGDLTVNGGNINLNGTAQAATAPFITFATQAQGVNSMYGIRGQSAVDDPWFIGAGSVGVDSGYLEIATGDNAGVANSASPIYVRQYNGYASGGVPWYGGRGTVVNELVLLDGDGNTSIPHNLAVSTNKLFVNTATDRVGINTNTPSYSLDVQGTAQITGNTILGGDLAVNGGDITTTATTFNLVNTAATTVNLAGAATTVSIGANTGTTTINNNLVADNFTTANVNATGNIVAGFGGATPTTLSSTGVVTTGGTLNITPTATTSNLVLGSEAAITTTQVITTSTATVALTTTLKNSLTGTITIQDTVSGAFHTVGFTTLRNGASAMLTTYGELYTAAALANFTADISGSNMRLLATPATANNTRFNIVRTSVI